MDSAPLLVQKGLSENAAGRYEVLHLSHWPLAEVKEAFGFSLDPYLDFGGVAGRVSLSRDPARRRRYLMDSLVAIGPKVEAQSLCRPPLQT